MKRRYESSAPLAVRDVRFNVHRVGRLTMTEFNWIDMARLIEAPYDIGRMASILRKSQDAVDRAFRRFVTNGVIAGEPQAFRFTDAAREAFAEADGWLLDPDSRPAKEGRREVA